MGTVEDFIVVVYLIPQTETRWFMAFGLFSTTPGRGSANDGFGSDPFPGPVDGAEIGLIVWGAQNIECFGTNLQRLAASVHMVVIVTHR